MKALHDRSTVWVNAVLADPAFCNAAVPNQLAEVMRRSFGNVNPKPVLDRLIAHQRERLEKAEALIAQTVQLATIPKDAILSPMQLLDLYGIAINHLRCGTTSVRNPTDE